MSSCSKQVYAALMVGASACSGSEPAPLAQTAPTENLATAAVADTLAPSSVASASQVFAPPPNASASASAASAPAPSSLSLRATTAMKLEGDVVTDKLVLAINSELGDLQRCAPMIRATDNAVGSINLELTIAKNGKVKTDLQSPVNDAAKHCLVDGMRAWVVKGAGTGKAMLLLSLE
jgi:hypothetical protein